MILLLADRPDQSIAGTCDGHGSAAHHAASAACCAASEGTSMFNSHHDEVRLPAPAAIFRKQSRHRQSPPSSGIGRRAVSSAHQHGPARPQVNSVPQPEQARRREAGFSNRFVINRTESG
jgi:hypothetical protein